MTTVLNLAPRGRRELRQLALKLRDEGRLYDRNNAALHSAFNGSLDRFVEICYRLSRCRRVLDAGAGPGLLSALLHELGHECCAVDLGCDVSLYRRKRIEFFHCNLEAERLPFPEGSFDGVVCAQALEHFTHSHLPAVREMHRVLKVGGVIEIDVPNVACFRNVSRLLRGKNITWDYEQHYLRAEPILHGGRSFYPNRHNREFTRAELALLLRTAGFEQLEIWFFRDRNYRAGLGQLCSLGSAVRDLIPRWRKTLMGLGVKTVSGTAGP